jgi:hypothetical protein
MFKIKNQISIVIMTADLLLSFALFYTKFTSLKIRSEILV